MFMNLKNVPQEKQKPGFKWVGVTSGMVGWFGVVWWISTANGLKSEGFVEPWDKTTLPGEYYPTEAEAQQQAYDYALEHSLPFDLPGFSESVGL